MNQIWPRNIYQKKPWSWQMLKNTNFRKNLWGVGADRISLKLFRTPGTIPEPSPILVFFGNFFRPKIASRESCRRGLSAILGMGFFSFILFFYSFYQNLIHSGYVELYTKFQPRIIFFVRIIQCFVNSKSVSKFLHLSHTTNIQIWNVEILSMLKRFFQNQKTLNFSYKINFMMLKFCMEVDISTADGYLMKEKGPCQGSNSDLFGPNGYFQISRTPTKTAQ